MSQVASYLKANKGFAIILFGGVALCLVALLGLGIVLLTSRGNEPAAQEPTATLQPTHTSVATTTSTATAQPSAKPTNTLVPVGTPVSFSTATPPPAVVDTAVPTTGPTVGTGQQPTTAPPDEDELADTGVGWGLILASGVGLALLFIAARRLRLTS
jgi:hypothetical protein